MPSGSSCHFCARANPAGSKFCNDCGEPLDLKPCSHCDAFNHVAVDRCYQCGTPFEAKQETLAVPEPTTAGAVESIGAAHPQPPPTRPFRVEPMLDPLER
ncbi:MAG TPA: zinc ribbon domain-containing protein, partial [Gemmatimonadaceae bacterium]